ncbi:hypothetical protein JYT28_01145 [Desulfobulbus sp. AH-315-M07]|nr:hypothetical protein [Desulfobulbus sp. AH-315-M07]
MRTHAICVSMFAVACGGATTTAEIPKRAASVTLVEKISPSLLVPEIAGDTIDPWRRDHARSLYLLGGLRVVVGDDGSVDRASQRFPSGDVKALELPPRFGGGFMFYQVDSQGTRMWRAPGWKQHMDPLAFFAPEAHTIVPGFDRLYLRARGGRRLMALDADDGAITDLGSLPATAGYGAMVFADGWRAVVDTDLRGPMATFDAGATWQRLGIDDRIIFAATVEGDPALYVAGGYYRIDARGRVHFVARVRGDDAAQRFGSTPDATSYPRAGRHTGRPLRLALERGWPDSETTAVYAHRGELVRVSLPDGAVLTRSPVAYPERNATCTALRLGAAFGFVCGDDAGATVLYEFDKPLALREFARFESPRFVASSGNGAVVVRGGCPADEQPSAEEAQNYCALWPDGKQRSVAVRGDVGVARVVALADGRIVVLEPPRPGADGKLTVIDGAKLSSHKLEFPAEPKRAVTVAKRGLWLEGFQEREAEIVSGWVEAGGPAIGLSVALDGNVTLGELYAKGGQLLASGSFALAVNDTEGALESIDGGKSWQELELPGLPENRQGSRTRGCTPVGCALEGWLRVGWGAPRIETDLQRAEPPEAVYVATSLARPVRLDCQLREHQARTTKTAPANRDFGALRRHMVYSTWASFRGVDAPKLESDFIGVDKGGSSYATVPVHTYVWGPKGADWTRAGWWQIRIEDRFDPTGGVRASALTRPPWTDEVTAAEAIGAMRRGSYGRWESSLEAGGDGALVTLCRGRVDCKYYAVTAGRPIIGLRTPGLRHKPIPHGVARIGEVWFFATVGAGPPTVGAPMAGGLELWRVELGQVRRVKSYRRLDQTRYGAIGTPKLVRRALGGELGWLIQLPRDAGSQPQVAHWVVLPIDVSDGSLGEPIHLGPADLGGRAPRRCDEQQDGWLVMTSLPVGTVFTLNGADGYLDNIEYRLRIDPGSVCADGISARAGRSFSASKDFAPPPTRRRGKPEPLPPEVIPLAARARYTNDLWRIDCSPTR